MAGQGKVPLLRAHPHHWGMGHIHQIDVERDQTLCGQTPARCPGDKFYGTADQITCKGCERSLAARERYRQYEAEAQERRRQREERNRYWWQAYDTYLRSAMWDKKRRLVLDRARGRCEGCGERK